MSKQSKGLMNGRQTMFVDQYGDIVWAKTLAELREKVGGSVSKMYVDKKDGTTVHCGYVIGGRWLTAFHPAEGPA